MLQRKAREIAAHENIPFSEALTRVRGHSPLVRKFPSSQYNIEFPKLHPTSAKVNFAPFLPRSRPSPWTSSPLQEGIAPRERLL